MTVRDDRGDVKQTTTGFRGPLMVQSLTSAKSKFLSLLFPLNTLYTSYTLCSKFNSWAALAASGVKVEFYVIKILSEE